MKGLIGFSTSKSWISKVINWFRKSDFSHTFVVLGEIEGKPVIGEAMEMGVRIAPLSKYLNKNTKLELWSIETDNNPSEPIKKVMDLTGRWYGFFQLVGFVWSWVWEKLGIKKGNPFTDGIICSEYVYYYLEAVRYSDPNLFALGANNVAPDHILNSIRQKADSHLVAISEYNSEELKKVE